MVLALVSSLAASFGYGLAPNLTVIILLFLVHAPEGFAQPALTALMSREAPDNAQGELQGGIASLQNIAMLAGTLFLCAGLRLVHAAQPHHRVAKCRLLHLLRAAGADLGLFPDAETAGTRHSTVTDFARLRGWSTSVPMKTAA